MAAHLWHPIHPSRECSGTCSQDPSSIAKGKRLSKIKSIAESHTASRQVAGPTHAHSTERMTQSDLRGPSDQQGWATDYNQLPCKTRSKNQTLQASENQARLDTLTREASGDCARSQKPLALSLMVWELSATYDHSCEAALQCKVTGCGLGLCQTLC